MHFVGSSYIVYHDAWFRKLKKMSGSLRNNGWKDKDWTHLAEDGERDGLV